jgi:hypothetical protein
VLTRTNPNDAKSLMKAEGAKIFWDVLEVVKGDEEYIRLMERHRLRYESEVIPEDTSPFEEDADIK